MLLFGLRWHRSAIWASMLTFLPSAAFDTPSTLMRSQAETLNAQNSMSPGNGCPDTRQEP